MKAKCLHPGEIPVSCINTICLFIVNSICELECLTVNQRTEDAGTTIAVIHMRCGTPGFSNVRGNANSLLIPPVMQKCRNFTEKKTKQKKTQLCTEAAVLRLKRILKLQLLNKYLTWPERQQVLSYVAS